MCSWRIEQNEKVGELLASTKFEPLLGCRNCELGLANISPGCPDTTIGGKATPRKAATLPRCAHLGCCSIVIFGHLPPSHPMKPQGNFGSGRSTIADKAAFDTRSICARLSPRALLVPELSKIMGWVELSVLTSFTAAERPSRVICAHPTIVPRLRHPVTSLHSF